MSREQFSIEVTDDKNLEQILEVAFLHMKKAKLWFTNGASIVFSNHYEVHSDKGVSAFPVPIDFAMAAQFAKSWLASVEDKDYPKQAYKNGDGSYKKGFKVSNYNDDVFMDNRYSSIMGYVIVEPAWIYYGK